jgi:hypothetical protein
MKEKLEEAKEHLWEIKDDRHFEKKSEEFINQTIDGLEKEVAVELLKFLYQLQRDERPKERQDQNKRLAVAKALINSAKYEEDHIYDAVDQHANSIVADFDEERREEYIDYRDKIQHEMFFKRERERDGSNNQRMTLIHQHHRRLKLKEGRFIRDQRQKLIV